MTLQMRVYEEIAKAPGSARELAERTNLTEKQVRSAIDGLRAAKGFGFIVNRPDGSFALDKGEHLLTRSNHWNATAYP
jgi:DNA-binding MarR family transcriptional regulator